jgi:hypothetical protein
MFLTPYTSVMEHSMCTCHFQMFASHCYVKTMYGKPRWMQKNVITINEGSGKNPRLIIIVKLFILNVFVM